MNRVCVLHWYPNMQKIPRLMLAIFLLLAAQTSLGWSRPGHMVTGAIAYEDLLAKDRQLIAQIVELLSKHPDRGPFEVATSGASGDERARRVFMQMARWPDDVRGSNFDHPTWHYSARPIVDERSPPASRPADLIAGAAMEAFALNMKVAADPQAPPAERALALCWIFHLVGDIHQPLHAADQFSARFPSGDRGGGLQFVRKPGAPEPATLHSYWDGILEGRGDPNEATASARSLVARFPRQQFQQLDATPTPAFQRWAQESYELARKTVYRKDLDSGTVLADAKRLPAGYVADATAIGERQMTLAGYRLADVLRVVFK